MALTQILVLKSLLSNFSAYDAGSSCGAGITSSMSMGHGNHLEFDGVYCGLLAEFFAREIHG